MSLSKLLSTVVAEETSNESLKSGGTNFIDKCGVYRTTIKRAFITQTKKGGLKVSLHFGGEHTIDMSLYIASMRNKKLTTLTKAGKTLEDFKKFIQLMYICTGELKDIHEIETTEESITYKSFGKNVTEDVETINSLTDVDLNIGVRLSEDYNFEDGEVDMTSLKTNSSGDVVYNKSLDCVFNTDGYSPSEISKEATEANDIELKRKFYLSDKAISRVKLEAKVDEQRDIESNDELEF